MLQTSEPSPYFELSEVLADPWGPEPESEWVELRNIGNAPGSLLGYLLRDSGGETLLPEVIMPPASVALIVGEAFVVNPDTDPVPEPTTLRVQVKEVGTRGLSNSGEQLVLLDPEGRAVSTIPALPATSGKSWSRVSSGDEAASFEQGEPTPGR
jgi:hypothetical protein